jgi:lipoate-protein ligase B
VTTDLSYFARINPCGFEASVMSSLGTLAPGVDAAGVKRALVDELGVALSRSAT